MYTITTQPSNGGTACPHAAAAMEHEACRECVVPEGQETEALNNSTGFATPRWGASGAGSSASVVTSAVFAGLTTLLVGSLLPGLVFLLGGAGM